MCPPTSARSIQGCTWSPFSHLIIPSFGTYRQLLSCPESCSASFPITVRLQGPFYSLHMRPTSYLLHTAFSLIQCPQDQQPSDCWLTGAFMNLTEQDCVVPVTHALPLPMSGGGCQLAIWFPVPTSAHSYKAREGKRNCIFLPTLYWNLLAQSSEYSGRVPVSSPSILFPTRLASQNAPLPPYSRREQEGFSLW